MIGSKNILTKNTFSYFKNTFKRAQCLYVTYISFAISIPIYVEKKNRKQDDTNEPFQLPFRYGASMAVLQPTLSCKTSTFFQPKEVVVDRHG